jgi:hypothetical protein
MYMRRSFGDAMISVGALALLVLMLAASDVRVREQILLRVHAGATSAQMASAGTKVHDLVDVIVDAVKDQSIEHAPLLIFVLAGGALFLFMLRT